MRSDQHFEVRNRIDAEHRVITIAAAQPAAEHWPPAVRATMIVGSAAALWIAIFQVVNSLI